MTLAADVGTIAGMGLVSVTDAAQRYGISERRIRELLLKGAVLGVKFGRTWAVDEDSLQTYLASPRKRGRPPRKA